jgi:zinc protease
MIKPEKTTLPNGMTVLLIESHQSPVVAFNACFRVGSVVEVGAEAGVCHFIEHMIFKGTPSRPAGQIASTIEASGGEINAYTSFDETVYYCTVSSRFFEEGLNALADAVMNPLFSEEEIVREKAVVIEEINRAHDTPGKVLSENLFKTTFHVHPYGRPIIGTKESVSAFTREDILNFYRRWYVPKNLVFVAAGDFRAEEAREKIARLFESFPSVEPPPLQIPMEPPQIEPRSVHLTRPFEGHYIQMAFPIPELTSPDLPSLDILSHLLGEGLSSRLEQRIKEKRGLVDSVYSYAYTPRHPGLFVIGFTAPEKKVSVAAREILKEIFSLKRDKIAHVELARARINIKSDAWYERETVEGLARKYGYFETIVGDYNFDKKYYQRIDEVDPEAVHEMVAKYLRPESLTLASLLPEGSRAKPQDLDARVLLKAAEHPPPKKPKLQKKEIRVVRLKNGLRLVMKENLNLPLVSVRLANLGGIRLESSKKNGLHSLLVQTLTKGTRTRSHEQLAVEIEQMAASIDAFSGRNLDGLQGDFLSEKLNQGLDVFCDILLNPAFEPAEIEKEKKNTLEAIRREHDQLSSIAYKTFLAKLYPHHPYGLPIIGTRDSVRSLNRKDLLQAHRQMINPAQMVISIVGDFDPDEVEEDLTKRLGSLKSSPARPPKFPELKPPSQPIKNEIKKAKMQSHIVLGFLGTQIKNHDRYAMDVMNNILAGQGGRLFLELRDKQSLAYSVTSFSQEGIERGFFSVYIATEPQKTHQAIDGILKELEKIRSEPVSGPELNRAKKYIVGSYELDLQRNSHVATQLAFNEVYGLGAEEWKKFPDKIEEVTREDVLEVAEKYIRLDAYVLSIVGA